MFVLHNSVKKASALDTGGHIAKGENAGGIRAQYSIFVFAILFVGLAKIKHATNIASIGEKIHAFTKKMAQFIGPGDYSTDLDCLAKSRPDANGVEDVQYPKNPSAVAGVDRLTLVHTANLALKVLAGKVLQLRNHPAGKTLAHGLEQVIVLGAPVVTSGVINPSFFNFFQDLAVDGLHGFFKLLLGEGIQSGLYVLGHSLRLRGELLRAIEVIDFVGLSRKGSYGQAEKKEEALQHGFIIRQSVRWCQVP